MFHILFRNEIDKGKVIWTKLWCIGHTRTSRTITMALLRAELAVVLCGVATTRCVFVLSDNDVIACLVSWIFHKKKSARPWFTHSLTTGSCPALDVAVYMMTDGRLLNRFRRTSCTWMRRFPCCTPRLCSRIGTSNSCRSSSPGVPRYWPSSRT